MRRLAMILVLVPGIAACGVMRNGTTQIIHLDSFPPGAHVRIEPEGEVVVTPGAVALRRKYSHVATVEADGYQPVVVPLESQSTDLWRNIVWIHPVGILIGIIVDTSTGGSRTVMPDHVEATLVPLQSRSGSDVTPGQQ